MFINTLIIITKFVTYYSQYYAGIISSRLPECCAVSNQESRVMATNELGELMGISYAVLKENAYSYMYVLYSTPVVS